MAVYPRWRGEHQSRIRYPTCIFGLSPLARGTRGDRSYDPAWLRFIPAGAGNTWLQTNQPASGSVYPRWRGEHEGTGKTKITRSGLSPLARGTH